MTAPLPAPSPGYNTRLKIFFAVDANGRRLAYRWSAQQYRAFRMPLSAAELLVETGQADLLPGHPGRPSSPAGVVVQRAVQSLAVLGLLAVLFVVPTL